MRILRKAGDVPKRSLWQKHQGRRAHGRRRAGSRRRRRRATLEQLEELLLEADFGVPTTLRLVEDVERLATRGFVKSQDEFLRALQKGIADGAPRGQQRSGAHARRGAADRHPRHRRERRGEDDVHRQARREAAPRGEARRRRGRGYLPRRRHRPASRVGRARGGGVHRRRAGRRSGRRRVRRDRRRAYARRGRRDHRHRGPPAHERRPDGRS